MVCVKKRTRRWFIDAHTPRSRGHGTAIAITVTNTIDSRAYLTTVCCQEKWSGKYLTYRTGGYGPANDAIYGDCVCLLCCLIVYTYVHIPYIVYSCSNSTITHAQNLCAKYFSHVVCKCSYVCVSEFDEYESKCMGFS